MKKLCAVRVAGSIRRLNCTVTGALTGTAGVALEGLVSTTRGVLLSADCPVVNELAKGPAIAFPAASRRPWTVKMNVVRGPRGCAGVKVTDSRSFDRVTAPVTST